MQVLSPEDAAPEVGRALRLTDAENGEVLDLVLDQESVGLYLERLANLTGALSEECRRGLGRFVRISSADSLEESCRRDLLNAGVLEL